LQFSLKKSPLRSYGLLSPLDLIDTKNIPELLEKVFLGERQPSRHRGSGLTEKTPLLSSLL
jgi:hypothetical protein